MAATARDVHNLLLQVDASVELAKRNMADLRRAVANDTDAMDKSLKRLDTSSKNFGLSVGKLKGGISDLALGFGVGTISVVAFGAALAAAVKDADKHAEALRGLNAVLDATGNKTGLSKNQLVEFSEQMENTFAITQEEILSSMQVLSQFSGVSGETFTRTMKLAADLSAVFGGDLKSNTEKLGTALQNLAEGNVEGLSRGFKFLGTETLETVKHLAEVGKTAQAQEVLLASLEKRVGGAGEAKTQGLSGAFFRLGDSIEDATRNMLDQIGVLPALISLFNRLANAIDDVSAPETAIQKAARLGGELATLRGEHASAAKDQGLSGRRGVYARYQLRTTSSRLAQLQNEYDAALADVHKEQDAQKQAQADAAADAKEAARIAKQNAAEREAKGGSRAKKAKPKADDSMERYLTAMGLGSFFDNKFSDEQRRNIALSEEQAAAFEDMTVAAEPLVNITKWTAEHLMDMSKIPAPDFSDWITPLMLEQVDKLKEGFVDIAEQVLQVGFNMQQMTFKELVKSVKNLIVQLLIIEPIIDRIRAAMRNMKPGGGGLLDLASSIASAAGVFAGGNSLGTTISGKEYTGPAIDPSLADLHGLASGGAVRAGGAYMVGEQGPELFVPRVSGKILAHGAGGSRSGVTNVINVNGVITTEQFWAEIERRDVLAASTGAGMAAERTMRARWRSLA